MKLAYNRTALSETLRVKRLRRRYLSRKKRVLQEAERLLSELDRQARLVELTSAMGIPHQWHDAEFREVKQQLSQHQDLVRELDDCERRLLEAMFAQGGP